MQKTNVCDGGRKGEICILGKGACFGFPEFYTNWAFFWFLFIYFNSSSLRVSAASFLVGFFLVADAFSYGLFVMEVV